MDSLFSASCFSGAQDIALKWVNKVFLFIDKIQHQQEDFPSPLTIKASPVCVWGGGITE